MKVAIMQPYFFPYIGYFQLIAAVDLFVVYDNIKYTKKGWINRNRMLENGSDAMFSLPLRNGSDALDVRDRSLAVDFVPEKVLSRFEGAYRRAPFFAQTRHLLESALRHPDNNLFAFLHHSLVQTCQHLGLATKIRISSSVPIDHTRTAQDKVLALCEALGATSYVNAIGGVELYSKDAFRDRGVVLDFIRPRPLEYTQFDGEFLPGLSILDVLMFNPLEDVRRWVRQNYDLI